MNSTGKRRERNEYSGIAQHTIINDDISCCCCYDHNDHAEGSQADGDGNRVDEENKTAGEKQLPENEGHDLQATVKHDA